MFSLKKPCQKLFQPAIYRVSLIKATVIVIGLLPAVALAQPPTTFKGLVNVFLQFFGFILIPFIISIIFLFFIWKVIDSWVINVGDEKKRGEGKAYVLAAITMMALLFSFWGLINILSRSLFGP